jgi:hypothetical protein
MSRGVLPARQGGSLVQSEDGFLAALTDTGVSVFDTVDLLYSCPSASQRCYLSHGTVCSQ